MYLENRATRDHWNVADAALMHDLAAFFHRHARARLFRARRSKPSVTIVSPGQTGLLNAAVEAREARRVAVARALRRVTHHESVRAEPVQNRTCSKPTDFANVGIGMQRIRVAAQSIEERLLGRRFFFDAKVRGAILRHDDLVRLLRRRVAAEPAVHRGRRSSTRLRRRARPFRFSCACRR